MRMGVASGRIAAGTVGGGKRRAYTVYGDPVNLSQRLQELAKILKSDLLICDETWRLSQPRDGFLDQGSTNCERAWRAFEFLDFKLLLIEQARYLFLIYPIFLREGSTTVPFPPPPAQNIDMTKPMQCL